ncbi:MAG: EMC3/TMCO1 family protein [Candidatus Norongarragalinales archaeon]
MRAATIEILLLSIVFAFASYYVSKTLGKRDEVRAIQARFNAHLKEMQDALKRNDEAKLKQLQARDKELNEAMLKTMLLPFRSLIVILPLYFILWNYLLPALFPGYVVTLPFALPFRLDVWNASAWKTVFGARGFFIWSTILAGFVVIELGWTKVEARALAKFAKLFKRGQTQTLSQTQTSTQTLDKQT